MTRSVRGAPWQIIRKSSFKPTPWKNGGGITHEVIRVPAQGDDFAWRVSVAQIDASGPFSDFAAYNRTMVLLKGDGVELGFENGQQRILRRVGDLLEFDGALAAHCQLLNGPCADLNLMVAKGISMTARVGWVQESTEAGASAGGTSLIFSIDAELTLDFADGASQQLQPWDMALLTSGAARVTREPRSSTPPAAVFFASIHH